MKISSNVKKLTTAALAGAMLFTQSALPADVAIKANAEDSYYYYDTFEDMDERGISHSYRDTLTQWILDGDYQAIMDDMSFYVESFEIDSSDQRRRFDGSKPVTPSLRGNMDEYQRWKDLERRVFELTHIQSAPSKDRKCAPLIDLRNIFGRL